MITIQDLQFRYENSDFAFRIPTLSIEQGEAVAIVGPSGSGKTTALNLIGCLDTPTEGEVYIEGKPTSQLTGPQLASLRADRIGFIFQSFNLIPVLSALENVELALQLAGRSGESLRPSAGQPCRARARIGLPAR